MGNPLGQVAITLAQASHYESIAAIYNESILAGSATMEERLYTKEMIAAWVKKFNEREQLYVMLLENDVIGWGIIKRYSDREGYRFACETAVYLTENQLRKGLGSSMKRFLLKQAQELGYRHLVAKIFADNKGSIAYNQKLGYTIVGRQEKIGFKQGRWIDVVIMQYIIEE